MSIPGSGTGAVPAIKAGASEESLKRMTLIVLMVGLFCVEVGFLRSGRLLEPANLGARNVFIEPAFPRMLANRFITVGGALVRKPFWLRAAR
jgi:hypothetical protein